MDALRKAEEAKKKAEQGDDTKQEQNAAGEDSSAVKESAGSEPQAPAEASSRSTDDNSVPAESGSIPDVALEFESQTDKHPDSEEQEQAAPSAERNEDFSLEPIDRSLSQANRQPIDSDVTSDPVSEQQNDAASEAGEDSSAVPADDEVTQFFEQSGTVSPPQPRKIAATSNSTKIEKKESPVEPSPPEQTRSVPAEPERVHDMPATSSPGGSAAGKPKIALASKRSPIRDRTEPDRRGAQTLFDAKLQGKKRSSIRIRRSTKIWIAQITIGLMLMIGAYFYFFVVNTSTDSFNVPEQYLVNQAALSETFNETLEQIESPIEEDSTDPLTLEVAAEEFEFEILEEPSVDLPVEPDVPPETIGETEEIGPEVEIVNTQLPEQVPVAVDAVEAEEVATAPEQEQQVPEPAPAPEETVNPPVVETAGNGVMTSTAPLVSSQGTTNSISFSRTENPGGVDPVLRDAYAAFQRDNYAVARDLYQQVLSNTPRNRDALLGLAAIANRNGEVSLAMELYSRLLARDPSDAVARAGLLGLRSIGGPEQQERELRRLRELHPEVAPVAYALGNFYATQDRWSDAQRYYFNALQQAKVDALQGLPVNPDYAFNLAVSLEHLNQSAAAETYYREAIAYAAEFPASFDVSIARNRLLSLAEVGTQ